jgi:hypothetical protein
LSVAYYFSLFMFGAYFLFLMPSLVENVAKFIEDFSL